MGQDSWTPLYDAAAEVLAFVYEQQRGIRRVRTNRAEQATKRKAGSNRFPPFVLSDTRGYCASGWTFWASTTMSW